MSDAVKRIEEFDRNITYALMEGDIKIDGGVVSDQIRAILNEIKQTKAENKRLRAALDHQVTGWREVLKLGVLEEREEWGAQGTLKAAIEALKGDDK
ncbi:hypothetical protein [Rosistilla oblonga]|uniref:hypothetical protein n=1 Tax=Rosistilla oblonga TaxID=2527990 RepID=UPI003A96E9F9